MRRSIPLDVRADIMQAWGRTGTVAEIGRRLEGRHSHRDITDVRDWALLRGYLRQRPPHGLVISVAGRTWLHDAQDGIDRPVNVRAVPKQVTRVQQHSHRHRILAYLHRYGSDCAVAIAYGIRSNPHTVRSACSQLMARQLLTASKEDRAAYGARGGPKAVYVYRITQVGRQVLRATGETNV